MARPAPRPQSVRSRSRFRPAFETLENRWCPTSISLSITPIGPNEVHLSGVVSDPISGAVQFSGQYNGFALLDEYGAFSANVEPAGLGTILASIAAEDGFATDQVEVTSAAPTIQSLQATRDHDNVYVLTGQVEDEAAAGLTVFFGGMEGLEGQSATVQQDGSFSLEVTVPYGASGTVTATTADGWGQSAPQAEVGIACPTPPSLTFDVTVLDQDYVQLAGQVTDAAPAGLTVTFSGVGDGTTTTDANGAFSLTVAASALGTIYATVTNGAGLTSDTAVAELANDNPTIQDFQATRVIGNVFILSGRVGDESPQGLTVSFAGMEILQGKTAQVQSDGTFNLSVEIPYGSTGTATADTSDSWNASAGTAESLVTCPSPPSLSFTISHRANHQVLLEGQVTDANPAGLTVEFTGEYQGTATTDSTGAFSVLVDANGLGAIYATVTNGAGLTSATVQEEIDNVAAAIIDFTVERVDGDYVVLSGRVDDEWAPGMRVYFSGLTDLAGKYADVAEDGTFELGMTFTHGSYGLANAWVTDWWGAESETAQGLVDCNY